MIAIGRWMDLNGESIYGSNASPYAKPPWGRYTRKAGRLYAHIFQWPENRTLSIPAGDIPASRAYLLADQEQSLQIEKTASGLLIHLPEKAPDDIASVVVIEHKEQD